MTWTRRVDFRACADSSFAEENRKSIQRADEERQALRQRELQAQASPESDPDVRVRTWERLHALSLPCSPDHPLVRLIARHTGLTVRQVRDEQVRRAGLVSR